ncbi:terminase large subunit [Terrihabitans rhizophilus]|uniref:Terminase TerL endonuclease subunit n=1 Tax=Terrihabitans rhizophilus TaxID=3092662 RepID=A0ABU4RNL1_9HYPH|nr:terminase TerL endonuclease subunit [Terrihabitans sp. PJ23]MDX6806434.1 terminase TerL endonuclease subunit [Terrihabitans sp. PJ23]
MTTIIRSPSSTYPGWIYDGSPIEDTFGDGERAVEFLRRLRHPKSGLPKKAFQLDPWLERIIRRIYGPRNPNDGTRIVQRVTLLLPRGNRKTSTAAALALLHTIGPERVPHGEAIFAALDRTQASIAFLEAAGIVRADPRIARAVKIYDAHNSAKKIVFTKDRATLEVISGEGGRVHGRTPSFVLADEIHLWPNGDLYEALSTGLDKSDESLLVIATTAGRGNENIAWRLIEDARKIARGDVDDPTHLPILFEADPKADWEDEALWLAVNPGMEFGYPPIKKMRDAAKRAERSAMERESFRQLRLNMWAENSESPFVDMAVYDAGAAPIDLDALAGKPCWLGVDMSTTTDLSAVVACFRDDDGIFTVLPHLFCPGDNLRARADRDKVPYPTWAEEGFITATPGNVIDYRAVEQHIRTLAERYEVREIAFDPAYANPVMSPLLDDGFPAITMRQGWVTQSPALNELERAIVSGNFRHGAHPVLRWCFSNVAIHTDSAGNRTMHKGKSTDRIDGAVATWMALSRAAAHETRTSIYENPAITADDLVW